MTKLRSLRYVLLALLCSVLGAQGSSFYGVIGEWTQDDYNLWTVRIDISTGVVVNVTEPLVFHPPAYADGLSAFDQKNGIYYWATDAESSVVYAVDVNHKQHLTPIDLGATFILGLNFDGLENRLLVLYFLKDKGTFLASAKTGIFTTLFRIPDSFDALNNLSPSLDKSNQHYHLIVDILNADSRYYGVATFDLKDGALISQVPLDDSTCNVNLVDSPNIFPMFSVFDEKTQQLMTSLQIEGHTKNGDESFSYYTLINPNTGICNNITSLAGRDVILAAFAYDPQDQLLWFTQSTYPSHFLFAFDTADEKLEKDPVILHTHFTLNNLEISNK